jgi:hypothetical protein
VAGTWRQQRTDPVITWDTIPLTGNSTITYQVTVNNSITTRNR